MRKTLWIPIALFAAGVTLIAVTVLEGDTEVSLFIIFPLFTGSSLLFLLAVLLLISSFIVGFILLAASQTGTSERTSTSYESEGYEAPGSRAEYGGVVLLGPIPIAFGSNKKLAMIMLIVGITLAVIFLAILLAA